MGVFCLFFVCVVWIDVGFGCGDQLLFWLNKFQPTFIMGVTQESVQCEIAKNRVIQVNCHILIFCVFLFVLQRCELLRDVFCVVLL